MVLRNALHVLDMLGGFWVASAGQIVRLLFFVVAVFRGEGEGGKSGGDEGSGGR